MARTGGNNSDPPPPPFPPWCLPRAAAVARSGGSTEARGGGANADLEALLDKERAKSAKYKVPLGGGQRERERERLSTSYKVPGGDGASEREDAKWAQYNAPEGARERGRQVGSIQWTRGGQRMRTGVVAKQGTRGVRASACHVDSIQGTHPCCTHSAPGPCRTQAASRSNGSCRTHSASCSHGRPHPCCVLLECVLLECVLLECVLAAPMLRPARIGPCRTYAARRLALA